MKDEMEKTLIALKKYLKSPAYKAELKVMKLKQDVEKVRYKKLEKHLQSLTRSQLTKLMDQLIEEHNDELRDYWYNKSCMPCLTNKMNFIFDYIFSETSLATALKNDSKEFAKYETGFSDTMVKYKGYVFQMFFGQGTAYRINKGGDVIFQW